MKKHDWPTIKSEYVQGIVTEGRIEYPTYEELAKRHKVSFGYLRKRAAIENWTEQRNIYIAKLEQKTLEKKTDKLAAQQADFDYEIFQTTKNLFAYIKAKMNNINRDIQVNEVLPALTEIEQLTKTLKQIQEIGKRALGEDPAANEIEIEVELV